MVGFIGDTKYIGIERIVVAMDIGTTHSAVSYAYLYPDDYPKARLVSKWPGQPESSGSSKIPTLVAYQKGECKVCGPEAHDLLDDNDYEVAKWFKLRLHPSAMRISDLPPPYGADPASYGFDMTPLPEGKTVEVIYTDFMRYLMENTRKAFTGSIPNGATVWNRLRESIVFILTTPNGWDLAQQGVLRRAAISAELVSSDTAQQLLEFVTEGEASVHYALAYSESKTWLAEGSMFAVIDAGGSTVDSTLYRCTGTNPRVLLEEVCPSECVQAGGIFVDRAAESVFRLRVGDSHLATEECITDMVTAFETRTKRLFDGTQASSVIDFGSSRDNDRARGIIKGKLSLTTEEVSTIFDGVVDRIKRSVVRLIDGRAVKYAILVGGLGESPYLQRRLGESFERRGPTIITAEEPTKKAAVEGALIWFVKQTVTSRIARNTFGVMVGVVFSSQDPTHHQRMSRKYEGRDGKEVLPEKFQPLITKGSSLSADFTHKQTIYRRADSISNLSFEGQTILVWEGDEVPGWTTEVDGTPLRQFRTLCTLQADLSSLQNSLKAHHGPKGEYYMINYSIAIRFGGTQLQATIEWEESGIMHEGPVTIIPNAII